VRLGFAAVLGICLLATGAAATTVSLSNASSDAATLAAADMDAAMTFSVDGSTMTLEVSNLSASPIRMSELYFNASHDVTSITLSLAPGHSSTGDMLWAVSSSAASTGFGTFDYMVEGIVAGRGNNRESGEIAAGGSAIFTFAVSGMNIDASDFGTTLSAASGADTAAYAAAAFHPNGGANNVTGAAVATTPEPSTALLLALGLGMLTRVSRRRH
jgi:hypothetical protein